MQLQFLGTRGYIEARTPAHGMHASCLVSAGRMRVMLDCGEDWRGHIAAVRPAAIFVTHAHPDHAWGLKDGAPCPVYATAETWKVIGAFPVADRRTVTPAARAVELGPMRIEAFPVQHSTRAPAVGYRLTAGEAVAFYVPDVVYIFEREAALAGVGLYVGDGATLERSMVRKPDGALVGHTPMRTQLTWCEKADVPRAVFTHLGTEVVAGDEDVLRGRLRALAAARGVAARFAHDGMRVVLRERGSTGASANAP